ncbi:MAG TPA: DUF6776 family protein [Solimonas sp.]
MQHKIVIARHRPWLKTGLVAGAVALLALLMWGLYSYTRATTVSDFERAQTELERAQDERRNLTRDLRAARAQVDELRNQVAYQKRSVEIDTHACDEVRQSLTALQSEVSSLREQLTFYRGMSPTGQTRSGVRVHDIKLQAKDKEPRAYSFDLTLIQSAQKDRFFGGSVRMEIQGLNGAVRHNLALEDIALGDTKKLIFSMKYYEEFRGEFRLPDGFKPQRVVVALQIDGENTPRPEESFEWNRILAGVGGNENVRR